MKLTSLQEWLRLKISEIIYPLDADFGASGGLKGYTYVKTASPTDDSIDMIESKRINGELRNPERPKTTNIIYMPITAISLTAAYRSKNGLQ